MQNQMGQMEEIFQERQSCVLPSNTDPRAELHVITSMDGLTLDGSFLPHSNFLVYQEKKQEPETITEVVKIASSKSTPLPFIPYPSRLKEENFQALENPMGRANHFVYRIDILDSFDSILEETDTLLYHHDSTSPEVDDDIFDSEGDILFLEGLLNDEISSDLPPLELNNDPEGDILFLENLLKDEPLKANKSEINPLIKEPPNTFLMGDEEIKLNSHEDIDDLVQSQRYPRNPWILLIVFPILLT
ncbi:hypothetical protein Tco_0592553 [Tanacetum coccineum]